MAIMAMDMKINRLLPFVLLCFSPFLYSAETLKITPSLTINQTYSDNINRSQVDKESGFVNQSGILLKARYKKKKSILNFSSSSIYSTYSHDHELDQYNHSLSADSRITLSDSFTLISGASIKNQSRNVSRFGADDPLYRNTIQTENYNAGLQYDIKNRFHNLRTSVAYQTVKAEDDIGENEGVTFNLISKNGSGSKNIFWDFTGNYLDKKNNQQDSQQHRAELKLGLITDYKFNPFLRYYTENNTGTFRQNNSDLKTTLYGVGFRWLPRPRLVIDLSYNTNADTKNEINSDESDNSLDLSINWQPTRHTQLQANHTQRSFGDSYGLKIQHKSKRLNNTISYTESLQSFTRNNYNVVTSTFLCQNPNAVILSDCFIQSNIGATNEPILFTINTLELTNEIDYSLNKSLSWNSTLNLQRTNFSLNITHSNRKNINSSQENETSSIVFTTTRKLGKSISLNFSSNYNEREFNKNTDTQQSDTDRRYRIGLRKQLNNALTINFDIERANRSSSQSFFNYKENRILAKISKDF